MTVTVEYAAKHLDELLDTLDSGDSVEIVRPDKPAIRLSSKPQPQDSPQKQRVLGAGRGEMPALSDEEWDRIDKEWRASFEDKFVPEAP